MSDLPEFREFPKISRWSREVIVTEKIDGTNAQVCVTEDGRVIAGSKSRFIDPTKQADNFGWAAWVAEHAEELKALGSGVHFGEWWGSGIQRRYGQPFKRWSLFNVGRWNAETPPPPCCSVVPVLWRGSADNLGVELPAILQKLRTEGSVVAPGFMQPEGVVIFHVAGGYLFKKTLEKDEMPKGVSEANPKKARRE